MILYSVLTGMTKRKTKHTVMKTKRTLHNHFTVKDELIKWVEVFKYLGWLMSMDNIDKRVVNLNIKKSHRC